MKKKRIQLFLFKLLVFSSPFFVIFIAYFIFDPYKVIYSYDNYYCNNYVVSNRDYVSTKKFLQNRLSQKYDSFIFGNSRSLAFLTNDWKKIVPGISPFHFDSSGESLYGITTKIRYIDEIDNPLKEVIIVLDRDILKKTGNENGHLFIKHPTISKKSTFLFYVLYIKTYFINNLYIKYLYASLFNRYDVFPDLFLKPTLRHIPMSNDLIFAGQEEEIFKNPNKYYNSRKKIFYERPSTELSDIAIIKSKQFSMLAEIKKIFQKHSVRYRIIIGPLYNQIKINKSDLKTLYEIFGKDKVYDFSGKNKYTVNKHNYYEESHFRHQVAKDILRRIYK